jgi:hypothetical protein
LERSLRYQKNNKHFFNYFGRILKKEIYPKFLSYINKLIKDVNNNKDVISFFIVKRLFKDDSFKELNKRVIYKFLISVFTLFYIHSKCEIKRDKILFYTQIGKIFYYGFAKKIYDQIFDHIKVLYPDFTSQQVYDLLYKNTGMYFMTFFSLFDFLEIKELSDNNILLKFLENEEIEHLKVNKKRLYGQNFPLFIKPKD